MPSTWTGPVKFDRLRKYDNQARATVSRSVESSGGSCYPLRSVARLNWSLAGVDRMVKEGFAQLVWKSGAVHVRILRS